MTGFKRERSYTIEQMEALLAVTAGMRNAPRWSVAMGLGLRQGEVLGLAWDDLELPREPGGDGTIVIRRELQRVTWQHGCLIPRSASTAPESLPSAVLTARNVGRRSQSLGPKVRSRSPHADRTGNVDRGDAHSGQCPIRREIGQRDTGTGAPMWMGVRFRDRRADRSPKSGSPIEPR
jgi:hypothetical protein